MSELVSVYSHNVKNGLEQWDESRGLMSSLEELQPDVAFYSEATSLEGMESVAYRRFLRVARGLGYVATEGMYGTNVARDDTHTLLLLHKQTLGAVPRVLTELNAIELSVQNNNSDQELRIVGTHLVDRKAAAPGQNPRDIDLAEHEEARLKQVRSLLEETGMDGSRVIMGDLNNMHASNRKAKMLRGWPIRKIAELMTKIEPGPRTKTEFMAKAKDGNIGKIIRKGQYVVARVGSLLSRLSAMAEGKAMKELEADGFVDADQGRQQGTMKVGPFSLFQLDHIMIAGGVEVDLTVLDDNRLSDHRGLFARISQS